MTKTLTEQWRDGTLAGGDYYIKTTGLGIDKIIINYYEEELKQFDGLCDCSVAEVLAPVPSYDEYGELLELNVYEKDRKKVMGLEDKIKRLQEQLNEANEVIKGYSDGSIYLFPTWYSGSFEANKYLKKWGVK